MIKSKLCPKCDTDKPLTEYYKAKARKNGHDIYCKVCQQKSTKIQYRLLREEAFKFYSKLEQPECINCGEWVNELLVLDHIEGGGRQDRAVRGSGFNFYRALKRDGWPEGFQVMCYNCNNLKHTHPQHLKRIGENKRFEREYIKTIKVEYGKYPELGTW